MDQIVQAAIDRHLVMNIPEITVMCLIPHEQAVIRCVDENSLKLSLGRERANITCGSRVRRDVRQDYFGHGIEHCVVLPMLSVVRSRGIAAARVLTGNSLIFSKGWIRLLLLTETSM